MTDFWVIENYKHCTKDEDGFDGAVWTGWGCCAWISHDCAVSAAISALRANPDKTFRVAKISEEGKILDWTHIDKYTRDPILSKNVDWKKEGF